MPTPKEGYYLDGTRIPGVTTVLGRYKDSGGLMHWAFERGAAGAKSLYEERQKAADVGTAAHALVEKYIKRGSVLDDMSAPEESEIFKGLSAAQINQASGAFMAFRTWASHSRLEIVQTEVRLVSKRHRYGGTPDAIGRIDGGLCLLDWKTSNKLYADHWLQVIAYIELYEENFFDEALTGAHVIRFGKELGDFSHIFRPRDSLDLEFEQFLAYRSCYEREKLLKKRAA